VEEIEAAFGFGTGKPGKILITDVSGVTIFALVTGAGTGSV
jgi:hypothetical protein